MTKLNQESGRSMVEMLGVLAIIGVLSIGGIAGYTMAMNRYRANEILNAASMLNVVAMSANQGSGDTDGSYATLVSNTMPAGASALEMNGANTVQVTFEAGTALCDTLENIAGNTRIQNCTDGTSVTISFANAVNAS